MFGCKVHQRILCELAMQNLAAHTGNACAAFCDLLLEALACGTQIPIQCYRIIAIGIELIRHMLECQSLLTFLRQRSSSSYGLCSIFRKIRSADDCSLDLRCHVLA